MNKCYQQGLLSAMIISLVACGGGGGGGSNKPSAPASPPASSVAPSSTAASSLAESSTATTEASSSVADSSSAGTVSSSSQQTSTSSVALSSSSIASSLSSSSSSSANNTVTTYRVNVTPIALTTEQPVTKTGRTLSSSKTLAPENFAVVIVDLAGNIVETIEVGPENIFENEDGTWSINVPGDPRLDCLIVTNPNSTIVLPSIGESLFDTDLIYTPTTDNDLELNLATTAAYQNFLDQLGGEGLFDSLNLDVSDTTQLQVLERLIETVQESIEDQIFTQYSSVADALAAVKTTVTAIVQTEAENIKNPAPEGSTLAAAITSEGGVHWYEAYELEFIEHGAITSQTGEVISRFNGTGFVTDDNDDDAGDLQLSASGWVVSADRLEVVSTNEDGSVTLRDKVANFTRYNVKALQGFDLGGRNISTFLGASSDTRLITSLVADNALFASGGKGYRVGFYAENDSYNLWYEPGEGDQGLCPWDKNGDNLNNDLASSFGGNCETVSGWTWVENQTWSNFSASFTSIADIKSPAGVAIGAPGSRMIGINWPGNGSFGLTIAVQLVNDEAKTANYYLYNYSDAPQLLGSSTWSSISLPGIEGADADAISVDVPLTVLGEGDFDDSRFIFAKHNGFLRIGFWTKAGEQLENGEGVVFNGTASDSILAATDSTAVLAGTWVRTDSPLNGPEIFVAIDKLNYMVATVDSTQACGNGLETGFYSLLAATAGATEREFLAQADQDFNTSSCGFNSSWNNSYATLNGGTLTLRKYSDEDESVITYSLLDNTGMQGTWVGDEPAPGDHRLFLSILPENKFVLAQYGSTDQENGDNGVESGTYTYNADTKAFVPTVTINNDREWGFSHSQGTSYSLEQSGNTLVLTFTDEGAEPVNITLTRSSGAAQ